MCNYLFSKEMKLKIRFLTMKKNNGTFLQDF